MNNANKLKFFLATLYLLIVSLFLWYFFNKYSLDEVTSYEFIKNNRDLLINFRESNSFLISLIFFIFTVCWVLLLGFGSPIALMGGFIFGKWIGTLIVLFALTTGATLLYLLAKFFFNELIREKFEKKFINLNKKFKKNEFFYFLIYRFVGGIPFFIANILPTLFNVKIKNYFLGTLIGIAPQLFIIVTLGSGIEKIIDQNAEMPSFIDLIFSQEIYAPILSFLFLIIIIFLIKNKIN